MRTRLVAGLFLAALVAGATSADAHRRWRPSVWVTWGGWWGWHSPWYGPAYVPVGPAPDLAVVDTDVSPEGARILLDGKLIGTADDFDGFPDYLYLKPGHYTLELQLAGYETETIQIDAEVGRLYKLDNDMRRVPGEPAAAWYDRPDGLPVGRVFGPSTPAVPAGTGAGPDRASRPEPRRSGADTSLRPELSRSTAAVQVPTGASLQFQVTPVQASVYLDGEFVGTGAELASLERGFTVAAGSHLLEVVAPGYEPRSVTLEVAAGDERQVVVELDPVAGQNRPKELH